MKTLYFECNMGAAGDMLMSALLELHDSPAAFLAKLNAAGVPGVHVSAELSHKCGIAGTHVKVLVDGTEEGSHSHGNGHVHENGYSQEDGHFHEDKPQHRGTQGNGHHHSGMRDIEHMVRHLHVSEGVKKNALAVYTLIAEAESHVHGAPVTDIHFHEVGTMDALADIVGVCMLMEELAPEQVVGSPVHVGSGQVRCSHGILPVPAPATAYILKNVPVYGGAIRGELCTPTGAALLKHFVNRFEPMPVMRVSMIGYGMGKRDFENANCVRAFLGEVGNDSDEVVELACNLDDMTPEAVAFVQQLLLEQGALDVYTVPIGMKKGRMGILFTCMCRSEWRDKMVALLFKHTTTLGMRESVCKRYILHREQREILTPYGAVRVKTASGYDTEKSKLEYEDVAKIARKEGLSLAEVTKAVVEADIMIGG